MTDITTTPLSAASDRLPISGLLALATAAFITILTEALPAGLLPRMSADLGVSQSLIGQLVTMYAVGSLVAAIPLTTATQSWRRRPLLLLAIGGFAVVNTITALSDSYTLTLAARFFAGVSAGLLWALAAGYASRMAPEHLKGRAIAIAMVGAPLALSLGIPAGTLLGAAIGWRTTFGIISLMTVALVFWVMWKVPDFAGQPAGRRLPLSRVFALPGIRPVLFVTLTYVLAHNILYTYIAPFLARSGLGGRIDMVLFVFGAAAVLSIWIAGALIDRWLRELMLISTALFMLAGLMLGVWGTMPAMVYAGIALWGLAFGGMATLVQTASAHAAGEAADLAQSMIVTVWNIAIAGGGIIGGLLLDNWGVASFTPVLVFLLVAALLVAARAKRHGFPRARA